MTEWEEREELVHYLKEQIGMLKAALRKMVEEKEARQAPLMFAYPWGVKVATRLKKAPDDPANTR